MDGDAGTHRRSLIILSGIGVLFDLFDAGGAVQGIATAPEFVWELSLGIYLTVKGFRTSSPLLAGEMRTA